MKIKFSKYYCNIHFCLLLLFFIAGHFIQVSISLEDSDVVLPAFFVTISKIIFFVFLMYSAIVYFLRNHKMLNLGLDHLLIVFFYFAQLIYALISVSDISRYFILTILYLFVPFSIKYVFQKNSFFKIYKFFNIILFLFFSISILLNFNTLFKGGRYQGLLYNANLYGFMCVFWISILLINSNLTVRKNLLKIIFIFFIFLTLFMSGSRTSLLSALIVLVVTYYRYIGKLIIPLIISATVIYFMVIYLQLDFIFERFTPSNDIVSESGRSTYWNKALNYIKVEPWWGYGMDAPNELVNSNIHNNYLRYLFAMGRIFTIITFIPMIIFIVRLFVKWYNKVPKSLVGYFCAFLVANFGEDYFIGITATSAIFTLINLGIIFYFMTQTKTVNTYENITN